MYKRQISLNANGMETNEGFRISPSLLLDAARGIVLGDLFMRLSLIHI